MTANLWDYASIIAKLIPNRFHPAIVSRTEGRAEHDVFPVAYRTNTRRAVMKWAMFNGFLFLLATGYEKVISKVPALNFLQGWIFVVLRKPGDSPA